MFNFSIRSIIATLLLTLILQPVTAFSDIINVPDDFERIQRAIESSEDGDTVLVQPGEYVENINFDGKAITVGSLILSTGDKAYIDSTIINADEEGSCVRFDHEEDENSILTGFTITGGTGTADIADDICGGGIHCYQASPTLSYLTVTNNRAWYGGGIFLQMSSPQISHVLIDRNIASNSGGGIYFSREPTEPIVSFSVISNNRGGHWGGGIGCYVGSRPLLKNITVVENGPNHGSAICAFYGNYLTMINSIIYFNDGDLVCTHGGGSPYDTLDFSYCNIEGEWETFCMENTDTLIWGDGNIDEDPLFVDLENDDYHLTGNSPCIDAGDPDSPQDADGSRADIGAFPNILNGIVEGYVLDAENNEPLFDAMIVTSLNSRSTTTDLNGFWRINYPATREFVISASLPGYLDSILIDQSVEFNDTLSIDFGLLHSVFQFSRDAIEVRVDVDDSSEVAFSINNTGNGSLEWYADERLTGIAELDPWELSMSYNTGEEVCDTRLEGVVFIDSCYYVSGSNISDAGDSSNTIYVLDYNGNEINRFVQPGQSRYGMNDLAWDGDLIWGCDDDMVIGFTTEGDSVTAFEAPDGSMNAITWDSDREILWAARKTGRGIYGCDREDNCSDTLSRCDFRLCGLGYWNEDPDGYNLYILHCPDNEAQVVHKMNTETGDTMFVAVLESEEGGQPGSAFITNTYDQRCWVMMNIANNGGNDRIDIWQIDANTSWMILEPMLGEIEAEASQDLILSISTEGLVYPNWEAELVFSHNAMGGETILPIILTIRPDAVEGGYIQSIPEEFAITSIYPNPFNSTTTITYGLDKSAPTRLRLFDLAGREIAVLVNNYMQAGFHTTNLKAANLPSGLYFIKLESLNKSQTRKIMLIK